jgi:hypothetical protein
MYSGHMQEKNMLTLRKSRNILKLAVKSWNIRSQLTKIGKDKYVLAEYEKVKRIIKFL